MENSGSRLFLECSYFPAFNEPNFHYQHSKILQHFSTGLIRHK